MVRLLLCMHCSNNDQGNTSANWTFVKQASYNSSKVPLMETEDRENSA